MVFYRKYRPQKIEELDSSKIRELLFSVLSAKDIAHAFLFTGPKGLGKTSTARIVAKAVNCLAKPDEKLKTQKFKDEDTKDKKLNAKRYTLYGREEPCNKCYQCISITNGTNIDVLEIDGASNRGIDEIRDLREKVRLAPATARKKVYIIDEVHMLTTEAFNALLKTLEEPPNHVIFVLCTTEPHKLPQTIVSRCLHIEFKTAKTEDLVRSFKRIINGEELTIEDDALHLIASLSDGSFRDGAKVLEEVALLSKRNKITKELVEKKYQVSSIKHQVSEMIEFLSKKDTKSGLQLIAKLVDQGVDIKYFMEQLIGELHEMLLARAGAISFAGSHLARLEMGEIKELVELLSRAYGELRYAVLPQLPLELAIVEWGIQKTQNPAKRSQNQVRLGQNTQIVRQSESQAVRKSDNPKVRHSDSPSFPSVPKMSEASSSSAEDNFWQELIGRVKLYNHSLAGVLRGCRLKEYDGKNLIIEAGYKFHKDRLEDKTSMEILKKVCKEISGKMIDVGVLLKEN